MYILLVEDDAVIADAINTFLSGEGMAVELVASISHEYVVIQSMSLSQNHDGTHTTFGPSDNCDVLCTMSSSEVLLLPYLPLYLFSPASRSFLCLSFQ